MTETHGNVQVCYLATNPKSLRGHVHAGEKVKKIGASTVKRAWSLNDTNGKPLRAARGVVLAMSRKKDAESLGRICNVKVSPSRIG